MRPMLKCDLYTQGDSTEEDFPLLAVVKWSQFLGWGWGLVFTCAGPKHPATVSGSPTVSVEGLVFLVSSILWGKLWRAGEHLPGWIWESMLGEFTMPWRSACCCPLLRPLTVTDDKVTTGTYNSENPLKNVPNPEPPKLSGLKTLKGNWPRTRGPEGLSVD